MDTFTPRTLRLQLCWINQLFGLPMRQLCVLQLLPLDESELRRRKLATILPSLCSSVKWSVLAQTRTMCGHNRVNARPAKYRTYPKLEILATQHYLCMHQHGLVRRLAVCILVCRGPYVRDSAMLHTCLQTLTAHHGAPNPCWIPCVQLAYTLHEQDTGARHHDLLLGCRS
jgi:hypothetical protein